MTVEDRFGDLGVFVLKALVSFIGIWFWIGAIVSPWAVDVGSWWPATLILGLFAAFWSAIAIWCWRKL